MRLGIIKTIFVKNVRSQYVFRKKELPITSLLSIRNPCFFTYDDWAEINPNFFLNNYSTLPNFYRVSLFSAAKLGSFSQKSDKSFSIKTPPDPLCYPSLSSYREIFLNIDWRKYCWLKHFLDSLLPPIVMFSEKK